MAVMEDPIVATPRTKPPTPKRARKVASKSRARKKAKPTKKKTTSARIPDRRSNPFGLTADQQRKKAGMNARDGALFERHERYWRAREILVEAVEEMLTASRIASKSARRTTTDKVKALIDALLKEHGDVPDSIPQKKSV